MRRSPRNYHARADADAAIEVHNVCVIHADAAVRHESADGAWRIGAVDRIFTAGQRHGRRSHRVMRGAAWNDARQRAVVAPDRCWRRPRRLDVLAIDNCRAGPLHAGAANAHRIADRFACTNKVIKTAFAGADDDRSRPIAVLHRHDVVSLRRPRGKSECRNGGGDGRREYNLSPHCHAPSATRRLTDGRSKRTVNERGLVQRPYLQVTPAAQRRTARRSVLRATPATLPGVPGRPTSATALSWDTDKFFSADHLTATGEAESTTAPTTVAPIKAHLCIIVSPSHPGAH